MKTRSTVRQLLFVGILQASVASVAASDSSAETVGRSVVQFSVPAPYASDADIRRRLGYPGVTPLKNDLSQEKFRVIIPEGYSTNSDWGLLVWVSPADSPWIPPDWEPELAKHHLLFVSAINSGNDRNPIDRFRLALDGTCNMCRQFKIDRKRIYIGGFSGGARMASMLGVACADIFTGTLCVCGVNFYRDVTAGADQKYPAFYLPDSRMLSLAKKSGRFVLLTGENDMNRDNTKVLFENGFRRERFSHVSYLEVPGMKHTIPGAADLNTALEYLAGDATPSGSPARNP